MMPQTNYSTTKIDTNVSVYATILVEIIYFKLFFVVGAEQMQFRTIFEDIFLKE